MFQDDEYLLHNARRKLKKKSFSYLVFQVQIEDERFSILSRISKKYIFSVTTLEEKIISKRMIKVC